MARSFEVMSERQATATTCGVRILTLIVVAALSFAPSAGAETVSFYGGRLSFELPSSFRAMTAQELALKYARQGAPPEFAFTAGRLPFDHAGPVDMCRFVDDVAEGLETALPDLNWKAQAVLSLNGLDWASLELTFEAPDQAVYSWMLLRPADGTVYTFTSNAVVSRLAEFRPVFGDVANSLRLGR